MDTAISLSVVLQSLSQGANEIDISTSVERVMNEEFKSVTQNEYVSHPQLNLFDLPNEILFHILSTIDDITDLLMISRTCSTLSSDNR